jgi:sec-independent protein translocase protein TatC
MPEPPATSGTPATRTRQHGLNERRLPLSGHLEELRRRVWGCVVVITLASMLSFTWSDRFVEWLKRPAGSALHRLAFFSPPEAFLAYMKVAITVGLFLSAPVILLQAWAFISPGLTVRERRYGSGFVWWGSALFIAGGACAYWVLLPVSLTFLLNFGYGQMDPVISISHYLSFVTMMILSCGLAFQLPLVMLILARLGLVNAVALRQKWPHAVVGIVVASAILTPTADVATLLLLAVPMLALYELSIWVTSCSASHRMSNE